MAPAAKVQLKGIFFSEDIVNDVNGYRYRRKQSLERETGLRARGQLSLRMNKLDDMKNFWSPVKSKHRSKYPTFGGLYLSGALTIDGDGQYPSTLRLCLMGLESEP